MSAPRLREPSGEAVRVAGAVRDWRHSAACRPDDAALFHPDHQGTGPTYAAEAKAVCARCPVRAVCLSYALTVREPYGVWGGLDAEERRVLLGVLTDVRPVEAVKDAAAPAPVPVG